MRQLFLKTASQNFFSLTYLSGLFLSFHYFFITYINSTVLSRYVNEKNLGVLYTLGSLLTIIVFLNIARILKKWGNYKAMLVFLAIEGIAIFSLAAVDNVSLIVIAFIVHHAVYPLIIVSLDVFLEHYSKNENTGKIRGIFLTIMNSTAIISPLLVGFLIGISSYRLVYFISACFIIALFMLVKSKFRNYRDSEYLITTSSALIIKFLKDISIREIFVSSLALQIFYSWMIVYVPIYLYEYLNFSWPQIGLIISVSLLPFVLFEIPLGKLADEKIGEKEILLVGFLLIIAALAIIGQTLSNNIILWIALLFLARSGASFVEIASDTYFFKRIDKTNEELISFWRMTNPLGYIIGTISASVALIILPFQYIFFALSVMMLVGLIYAAKIKDTL